MSEEAIVSSYVEPQEAEQETVKRETNRQATLEKVPDELQEEKVEETPEQAAKRNQNRIERRINKATKQAYEQKARADYLEQQLEAQKPRPRPADDAPRIDDFDDLELYTQARIDHARETERKAEHAERQERTQHEARAALTTGWENSVTDAEDRYPDFHEVVGDLQPGSPWSRAIMKSPNGPDIAHYLGTNIREAEAISRMDPESQIYEIARLSAKLSGTPARAPAMSKAPPPIRPVGGAKSGVDKRMSEMSQSEFEERRAKVIAARR